MHLGSSKQEVGHTWRGGSLMHSEGGDTARKVEGEAAGKVVEAEKVEAEAEESESEGAEEAVEADAHG